MTDRNSNIELLRIVAILFIIAHHLLVHGLNLWSDNQLSNFPLLALDSAFFVGVNVFVLISGYCGIQFRFKKLLYLYLMCALVGGLCYLGHLYVDHAHIGRSIVYNTIFSISNAPGTWYIQSYIFLMLAAPLLNAGIETLNKKGHLCAIAAWTLISVYFGWWWQHDVNQDGYNLVNFIWLYIIGGYLKRYWNIHSLRPYTYLGVYAICSIVNAGFYVWSSGYFAWCYNNPFVVIASISLVLFFLSFDFQNKYVNILAQSTLGVYLIHENCYVSPHLYDNAVTTFYSTNVFCFVSAVSCIYFVCVIVDVLLRYLIANPIFSLTPPPIFARNNTTTI